MSNVAQQAANGKARTVRRPARSVQVVEAAGPDTGGWCAVRITVDRDTTLYLLRRTPTDFGEGFELEKLDADLRLVETYHVLAENGMSRCDCRGHEQHGHCKHAAAIAALEARGQLPALFQTTPPVCPHCEAPTFSDELCDCCATQEVYAAWSAYVDASAPPPDADDPSIPPGRNHHIPF